jgi:hypothetical protein
MRAIVLGGGARLRRLVVVPGIGDAPAGRDAPEWATLFTLAGLDMSAFDAAAPGRLPPVFSEQRLAWTRRTGAGSPLRVEASAYQGRIVWVDIFEPTDDQDDADTDARPLIVVVTIVTFVVLVLGGGLLAVRNLRLGRGDMRGALKGAAVTFVLSLLSLLFAAKHSGTFAEVILLIWAVGGSLWFAGGFWLLYLAVEPFVRRRWPDLIITWSRFIAGRWNDPLIGRDILIAGLIGVLAAASEVAATHLARSQGWAAVPQFGDSFPMLGLSVAIAVVASAAQAAFMNATLMTVLLVLITVVLRRRLLALAAFFLIILAIFESSAITPMDRVLRFLPPIIATLLVARLGLVAIVFFHLFLFLTAWLPITLRLDQGYAAAGMVGIIPIVMLTGWSVYTSLGGKPFAGLSDLDAD